MESLNSGIHAVLYVLLGLSGATLILLLVLLVAQVRKKDYSAPKRIAIWAGIATSVGSFAIAALNVSFPIGILPQSDPAYQAISTFYSAIQSKRCRDAWILIHSARKAELMERHFSEVEFCGAYETTRTYDNLNIERQDTKQERTAARSYRVSYDVTDEFPRNDLFDLRLKDFADVTKSGSYDEKKLIGIIVNNMRLYYVVPTEAEEKIKELIANTPFWFIATPEFIAEMKRLLSVKYRIELAAQTAAPPSRRVDRHFVHNLVMEMDSRQWKIRDGLAAPVLVAPYVPRDRVL
jgi:hypothetical protein